ncbi:hypothetical protein VSR69_42590 [Paraburkholderia phytofirmans]|nr:hypothetical protein [Paraburkholderia sp. BL9I2N2]TCK94126.1 hypothetical protein B0G74_0662 [Paraburkholderia sp. BL9I2N2]
MDKTFVIPANLLAQLLEYLAARPYREVATAMQELQHLKEIPGAD